MSNLENEIWKSIDGWPSYEVSNFARVKSLARTVRCGRGFGSRKIKESILSSFICKNTGYRQVVFSRKKQNVHRLVAIAFLGKPPFIGAQVNHKNSDRSYGALENLEWVTPSENQLHSFSSNGRKAHNFGKFGKDATSSKAVIATNIKTLQERRFDAAMDAVREGFKSDGISRACNGIISSHFGFYWRFALAAELNINLG